MEDAAAMLQDALSIASDYRPAIRMLADVRFDLEQFAGAAALYERIADDPGPEGEGAYTSLAICYDLLGRLDRARDAAERGTRRTPSDANAFYVQGVIAAKMGRVAEARGALANAIRLNSALENSPLAEQLKSH